MDDLAELLIVVAALTTVGLFLFFVFQILNLKVRKLKREFDKEDDFDQIDNLKKDIGYLMAENEDMKEELRNIKYLLSQGKEFIDSKEYEKEQIRIDRENKYNS
ncbi:hypothetical protein [Aureispira anguillae]|uniref:Uncharacterized protein n=1 Tax=Aureispira anguillae TaxID=2864201 RepID=A0A915YLN4_9BACT|nr:hypothetical protein [Aureispira anguillae]BDS15202.1 hypothetical protein AsAng_0059860 [Aureispira anguillae]